MTIYRVQKTDLPEINRVLELIQKNLLAQNQTANKPSSGTAATGSVTIGTNGTNGTNGTDGVANLDLFVTARSEEEELLVTNSGDIISDVNGFAVTGIKEQWSIVTDNNGNIITVE